MKTPLELVVEELADPIKWNWAHAVSFRDAANRTLRLFAKHGLIEQKQNPSGGTVWRINGNLYGRTDGIEDFDKLHETQT